MQYSVFALVVKFLLRKFDCAFTWYKNAVAQFRNCVARKLNHKVYCESCAEVQKLKKLNSAFRVALLLVEEILALCF